VLPVEIEAVLNAGHCVEPDNEMQVSAIAVGITASTDNSADLVLNFIDRCFRSAEHCLLVALGSIIKERVDSVKSKGLSLSIDGIWLMLSRSFSEISSLIFRSADLPQSSTRNLRKPSRC
jgi:hypothetical protein